MSCYCLVVAQPCGVLSSSWYHQLVPESVFESADSRILGAILRAKTRMDEIRRKIAEAEELKRKQEEDLKKLYAQLEVRFCSEESGANTALTGIYTPLDD